MAQPAVLEAIKINTFRFIHTLSERLPCIDRRHDARDKQQLGSPCRDSSRSTGTIFVVVHNYLLHLP